MYLVNWCVLIHFRPSIITSIHTYNKLGKATSPGGLVETLIIIKIEGLVMEQQYNVLEVSAAAHSAACRENTSRGEQVTRSATEISSYVNFYFVTFLAAIAAL